MFKVLIINEDGYYRMYKTYDGIQTDDDYESIKRLLKSISESTRICTTVANGKSEYKYNISCTLNIRCCKSVPNAFINDPYIIHKVLSRDEVKNKIKYLIQPDVIYPQSNDIFDVSIIADTSDNRYSIKGLHKQNTMDNYISFIDNLFSISDQTVSNSLKFGINMWKDITGDYLDLVYRSNIFNDNMVLITSIPDDYNHVNVYERIDLQWI